MDSLVLRSVSIITLILAPHLQHAEQAPALQRDIFHQQEVQTASEPAPQGNGQTSGQTSTARRLEDLKSRLAIQEQRLESLEEVSADPRSATPDKASSDSPSAIQLREQLLIARQQLINLQSRYTDLYPDVIAAREQVASLTRLLDAENGNASQHPDVVKRAPGVQPSNRAQELGEVTASIEKLKDEIEEAERQAPLVKVATRTTGERLRRVLPNSEPQTSGQTDPVAGEMPLTNLPTLVAPVSIGNSIPASTPPAESQQRSLLHHSLRGLGIRKRLILALSVFVFLASAIIRHFRNGRQATIQDSAALQALLPDEADYVGCIPRMDKV